MWYSLPFLLLSSYSTIKKSLFNSSSLSGSLIFVFILFSWLYSSYSLPLFFLLRYFLPLYVHLVLWLESWFCPVISALLIVWFKEWCKFIDVVLRPCPFPSNLSNCSMMALTFIDYIFRDDLCWSLLGRFTLLWQWMLVIRLDWLFMILGGDLDVLMVFFQIEVVSM